MAFRGKVDYVPWICELTRLEHEHPAGLHFGPLARRRVGFKVCRKHFLELQSDTSAHYANAVNCVDESFGISCQNVASLVLDHGDASFNSTSSVGSLLAVDV